MFDFEDVTYLMQRIREYCTEKGWIRDDMMMEDDAISGHPYPPVAGGGTHPCDRPPDD